MVFLYFRSESFGSRGTKLAGRVVGYTIFLRVLAQQWMPQEKRNSLEDEDDARISNTCIAQTKRAIPHSTMKTHRNIMTCAV